MLGMWKKAKLKEIFFLTLINVQETQSFGTQRSGGEREMSRSELGNNNRAVLKPENQRISALVMSKDILSTHYAVLRRHLAASVSGPASVQTGTRHNAMLPPLTLGIQNDGL